MDDRTLNDRSSTTRLAADPVAGFGYCPELPPDVPPGMTLEQWRRRQRRRRNRSGQRRRRRLIGPRHPGT
jgi:hypothetical protein